MLHVDAREQVLEFLQVHREAPPHAQEDDFVVALVQRGIAEADAEALIAFVPCAFAHVWFAHKSVPFLDGFLAWDPDQSGQIHGRLSDEPVFVAAKVIAKEAMDKSLEHWVLSVASMSAEYACAEDLFGPEKTANRDTLLDVRFTEPVFQRIPLHRLQRADENAPDFNMSAEGLHSRPKPSLIHRIRSIWQRRT
jgi:hypothetical protein